MNDTAAPASSAPLWRTPHDQFENGRLSRCGCDQCYEASRRRLAAYNAQQDTTEQEA